MSDALTVGRNIHDVRVEKGLTQRDVYEATGISASQLSAYENGKQMVGLTTLAKIAVALGTSIDRLYYGSPSEAFINQSENFGETVVNCFRKLRELGVVSDVSHATASREGSVHIKSCAYELSRMFSALRDFEFHKEYYPDEDAFLDQLYKSVANEINVRERKSR